MRTRISFNTLLFVTVFLHLPWAEAQRIRTPSASDPLGSRSTSPSINSQPADAPRVQKRQQLRFVKGSVVQDDGTPPLSGTVIERVCNGKAKREADVDSKGNFSFQIGASNVLPDASDETTHAKGALWNRACDSFSGPFGVASASATDLMGCELRAQLGGFRSSTVALGQSGTMGDIDVGTIVIRPVASVSGTTVSVTSMLAPKEAQKAFVRADKEYRKKEFREAVKNLRMAIGMYPRYAAAWFELGQIYQKLQQTEDARRAYLQSIEADSNYVKPYVELARIAVMRQRWLDAAEITDRALGLDPLDFCEAYLLNSLACYSLNKLDAAERSARKGLRLDGLHRYPQLYLILANILYEKGEVTGATEQLRSYVLLAPNAVNAGEIRSRIQDLEAEAKAVAPAQTAKH